MRAHRIELAAALFVSSVASANPEKAQADVLSARNFGPSAV